MSTQQEKLRRLTVDALLLSLALVLSVVERWIPLELLVPLPGIKLGLANVVTLLAVLELQMTDALALVFIRSLLLGFISGPTTFAFSLTGGLLALLVMWGSHRINRGFFSIIGISLQGAAAHNMGQVAVAALLLQEPRLLTMYLPLLLLTGLVTGTLTGLVAQPVVAWFRRTRPEATPAKPSGGPT